MDDRPNCLVLIVKGEFTPSPCKFPSDMADDDILKLAVLKELSITGAACLIYEGPVLGIPELRMQCSWWKRHSLYSVIGVKEVMVRKIIPQRE